MKKLTLIALLLVPTFLWANRVLLVTDIDDTIKVSHVLDKDSAARNAVEVKNAFMGMPELLHALTKVPGATPVHYLSNAPEWLMKKLHGKFVKKNKFPKGVLVLNGRTIDHEHKINSLRKMIEEFNPSSMILIGDNGERDNEVYEQIRAEFRSSRGPLIFTSPIRCRVSRAAWANPFSKTSWAGPPPLTWHTIC